MWIQGTILLASLNHLNVSEAPHRRINVPQEDLKPRLLYLFKRLHPP